MAIYYLDYENGNNSNNGTTWALAKKTIDGFTSLSPGDIVRIAKSPDPTLVGSASWTNNSRTVTLSSAVNATIDNCDSNWTASTNVTTSTSTTRKQGSNSLQVAIAAAFTTGKVAYRTLPSTLNLSGYQQISFWILPTSGNITANQLKICLCSDSNGDTIVDSFYIPDVIANTSTRWMPITINKGSAIGSSINSIAIYADVDPGTVTFLIDNIIACKAPSQDDSLSLTSLISKNNQAQGGSEAWYPIKSIEGATITIDCGTSTGAGSGQGYYGTTETANLYKRETIKTIPVGANGTVVQSIQVSGSSTSGYITFSGGWDKNTNEQNGETFFDGQNGFGYGINLNGKNYIVIERVNVYRYYDGIFCNGSKNIIKNAISIGGNSGEGILFITAGNCIAQDILFFNNNGYGVSFGISSYNCQVITVNNQNTYFVNHTTTGIYHSSGAGNVIKNGIFANNSSGSIRAGNGVDTYLFNCLLGDSTEIYSEVSNYNAKIYSHRHDQVDNNYVIFTDGGRVYSDTSTRHTNSGIAWRMDVISTNRASDYPFGFVIARIAVEANKQVTVKAWFRRNNTGITGRLICKGGQIAGVGSDVYADMTASANTWQQLSISFTPTEAGVVEIEAQAWGGSSWSVWVDDLEITQS